jgi:CheY-like chemotaxis protein
VSTEQVVSVVEAVTGLVSALAWPLLVFVVLLRFRAPIAAFLANMESFSFKAPGVEATAKQRQMEAAASLGAAAAAKGATDADALDVGSVVGSLPGAREQASFDRARVLWVDDNPGNNRYETRALEALGIRVETSLSTEDALARQRERPFDLILSDMGRGADSRAGFTLLDELRRSGDTTPFVIYAGSREPEHVAESRRRGALGCTNRPDELLNYVREGLRSSNRGRR